MKKDVLVDYKTEFEINEVIQRLIKLNQKKENVDNKIDDVNNEIKGEKEQKARMKQGYLNLKESIKVKQDELLELRKKHKLNDKNEKIVNKEIIRQKQIENQKKEQEKKKKSRLNFFKFFQKQKNEQDEDYEEENLKKQKDLDLNKFQNEDIIIDEEEQTKEKLQIQENEFRIIRTLNNIIDNKHNDVKLMEKEIYQNILVSEEKLSENMHKITSFYTILVKYNLNGNQRIQGNLDKINVYYDQNTTFYEILKQAYQFWSLPGEIQGYQIIDDFDCEIILDTKVNEFFWQRTAMDFSQKMVQIEQKKLKQSEINLNQDLITEFSQSKENLKERPQEVGKGQVHIYRNQVLTNFQFIDQFFIQFQGLVQYISNEKVENPEENKIKGKIGYQFDDYSFISLGILLMIFAMSITSYSLQNEWANIYAFNTNFNQKINSFKYVGFDYLQKPDKSDDINIIKVSEIYNQFQFYQYLQTTVGPILFASKQDQQTKQVVKQNQLVGPMIMRQLLNKQIDCSKVQTAINFRNQFQKCLNNIYQQSNIATDSLYKGDLPKNYYDFQKQKFDKSQPFYDPNLYGDWRKYTTAEQNKIYSSITGKSGYVYQGDGYVMKFNQNVLLEDFQKQMLQMQGQFNPEEYKKNNNGQTLDDKEQNQITQNCENSLWFQSQTYAVIVQFNVYNPQVNIYQNYRNKFFQFYFNLLFYKLNIFTNVIIIVESSVNNYIRVNQIRLSNFKVTLYGDQNSIGAVLKTIDLMINVLDGIYLFFMMIQFIYTKQTLNLNYLLSYDFLINLIMIACNFLSYYYARCISDITLDTQDYLNKYPNTYTDFTKQIDWYAQYKFYWSAGFLMIIYKIVRFFKLNRRIHMLINIIEKSASLVIIYYIILLPIYIGINESFINLQGKYNDGYSDTATGIQTTLIQHLTNYNLDEIIYNDQSVNIILFYFVFLISFLLYQGILVGFQIDTYTNYIKFWGYDFKSIDSVRKQDFKYYIFAWLPEPISDRIVQKPQEIRFIHNKIAEEEERLQLQQLKN